MWSYELSSDCSSDSDFNRTQCACGELWILQCWCRLAKTAIFCFSTLNPETFSNSSFKQYYYQNWNQDLPESPSHTHNPHPITEIPSFRH